MSLLKTEPAGTVTSLEELFAIAAAMEHEAATRYAEIAERMRKEDSPALAEVFGRLSADEQGHLDSVMHWSQKTKGRDPDPALIRWELPEIFDDEGTATMDSKLLNAYRTLSMAVRNEERAFAFWSYVAAHAEAPEIQRAAEAMAHEELGHVAILRSERRKAFHAERQQPAGDTDRHSGSQDLATLERRLAALLKPLAEKAPAQERTRLQAFAEEAERHAVQLERSPIPASGSASVTQIPDDPLAMAELLADRYLEAGDTLRDEKTLAQAQVLAARAVSRLAWLRADLPELHA